MLDLRPRGFDQLHDIVRDRDVVERLGFRVAVLVGPREELQRRFHGFRVLRVLVDDDPGRSGDRPRLGTRLVGDA